MPVRRRYSKPDSGSSRPRGCEGERTSPLPSHPHTHTFQGPKSRKPTKGYLLNHLLNTCVCIISQHGHLVFTINVNCTAWMKNSTFFSISTDDRTSLSDGNVALIASITVVGSVVAVIVIVALVVACIVKAL